MYLLLRFLLRSLLLLIVNARFIVNVLFLVLPANVSSLYIVFCNANISDGCLIRGGSLRQLMRSTRSSYQS